MHRPATVPSGLIASVTCNAVKQPFFERDSLSTSVSLEKVLNQVELLNYLRPHSVYWSTKGDVICPKKLTPH